MAVIQNGSRTGRYKPPWCVVQHCLYNVDAASLLSMCANEIVVPIPYPGSTPDFDGLISVTNNSHIAFPDFKMTAKDEIVDEKQSRVVLFLNIVTGTQAGYVLLNLSDCSEWLGIPGTGKRTDVQGLTTHWALQ
jgi:hypothetical protein